MLLLSCQFSKRPETGDGDSAVDVDDNVVDVDVDGGGIRHERKNTE
jgi:hypothetical protein